MATRYTLIHSGKKVTDLAATAAGDKDKYLHSNASTGALEWSTVTSGSGLTWSAITTDTTLAVDNGYITNSTSLLVLTLPTTAAVGKTIRISGLGTGGWILTQGSNQVIHFANGVDTTTGINGGVASTYYRDYLEIVCVVANNEWNVVGSGNILNII